MGNQVESYSLRENLTSSDTFGSQYEDLFSAFGNSFEYPIHKDIESRYNNIMGGDYTLTDFQRKVILKIFEVFKSIQASIDPNKIKVFDHFVNDDEELVLWRKDENKLINLIIHDSDDVALSYVTKGSDTSLTFYNLESDFQILVFKFLS